MKVMLLGTSPHSMGGVATYIRNILESPLSQTYGVTFFPVGSQSIHESLAKRIFRISSSALRLTIKIVRENPTIVHINPSLDRKAIWRDSIYVLLSKALGKKVVVQIHGQRINDVDKASQALVRSIFNMADRILVLSRIQRKGLERIIKSERIELVPNMVDTSQFLVPNLQRENDQLKVLFVARLLEEKGAIDLLRAIPIIVKKIPGAVFTFAGSGEDENKMKKMLEELGIKKYAKFVGHIRGEELVRLYMGSDVFVFPTYYKEGFPFVILEAMAAGLPIITCPEGAIPEIIEDGTNGFLVPPKRPDIIAERTVTLATDRNLRVYMKRNNIKKVKEKYDVSVVSKKIAKLYDSI